MRHHQRLFSRFTFRLSIMTWVLLFTSSLNTDAQTLEEMELELALLEAELDSVSLLGFIDSLIQLAEPKSAISIGTGYSNQVFTNGQDLGIQQFGINNSLNYYHKSGIYGSYNNFYNSETDQGLYLNIIGIGYLGSINSSISYNAGFEKSFFTDPDDNSLTNTFTSSLSYSKKAVFANISYSFIFEDESAHQIIPSVSLQKSFYNILFFKRIDITPTFSFFWASPNSITASFSEETLKESWLLNQLPPLTLEQFLSAPLRATLTYNRLSTSFSVKKNRSITLLNKSLSIPINFQINDKFSFSATYSYLFSEELFLGTVVKDENSINNLRRITTRIDNLLNRLDNDITFENLENSSYISLSLSYFLTFK